MLTQFLSSRLSIFIALEQSSVYNVKMYSISVFKCLVISLIVFLATGEVSGQKTKTSKTQKSTTTTTSTTVAPTIGLSTDALVSEPILSTTDSPVVPSTAVQTSTLSDIASFPVETSSQLPDDTRAVQEAGKRCIMIKMDAKFDLEYRKKDQSLKLAMALPDDYSVTGSCGSDKKLPEVALSWKSYQLLMVFDKSSDGRSWFASYIQINYNPAEVFKDPKLKKSFRAKSLSSDRFVEAPMGLSFACSEPRKIILYDDQGLATAYAVIEGIKIQAYLQDDTSTFGQEFECGTKIVASPITNDDDATYPPGTVFRSETVPIAVGSTLAVITVLVVAAYAVYRSLTVKKMEYATFEE